MGTRHLICIFKNGQYKVAQYGQWDGYPSGQGVDILSFLKNKYNKDKFSNALEKVRFGTNEEIEEQWIACGANKGQEWVSSEISDIHRKKYPENSRDTGSEILNIIQNDTKKELVLYNHLEFAKDSLFCEYAYVIDLDKNTFEIYVGFNKEPLSERERFFFGGEKLKVEYKENYEYYPVKLLRSYDLDNLPSQNDFLKELEPEDE